MNTFYIEIWLLSQPDKPLTHYTDNLPRSKDGMYIVYESGSMETYKYPLTNILRVKES